MGISRHFANSLIQTTAKFQFEQIKLTNLVKRSQRIRLNSYVLPSQVWLKRKNYFINNALQKPKTSPIPVEQDPLQGLSMMKQQMLMIVPQMLSMGWVSYFFAGFVLLKLPFGLTQKLKIMIQRGINIKTLDSSYVSSLSWYFLNMLGLVGVQSLFIGPSEVEMKMIQAQMSGSMNPGVAPDINALIEMVKSEKTEVEITNKKTCTFIINKAENELINENKFV